MRGTLHLVAAEDLPLDARRCSARALAGVGRRRRAQLELTDADVGRPASAVVGRARAAGARLRRADAARRHRRRRGRRRPGQRGYHLLWYLAQSGTLCLGPTDGDGEQLFVLLDEWVPDPRRLERDEALGELARRFFRGHGRPRCTDLVRWSGLHRPGRPGRARRRPRAAPGGASTVDGAEYLLDPETPDRLAACRDGGAAASSCCPASTSSCSATATAAPCSTREFADRIVPGEQRDVPAHRRQRRADRGHLAVRRRRREAHGRAAEPFTTFPEDVAAAIATRAALPGMRAAGALSGRSGPPRNAGPAMGTGSGGKAAGGARSPGCPRA